MIYPKSQYQSIQSGSNQNSSAYMKLSEANDQRRGSQQLSPKSTRILSRLTDNISPENKMVGAIPHRELISPFQSRTNQSKTQTPNGKIISPNIQSSKFQGGNQALMLNNSVSNQHQQHSQPQQQIHQKQQQQQHQQQQQNQQHQPVQTPLQENKNQILPFMHSTNSNNHSRFLNNQNIVNSQPNNINQSSGGNTSRHEKYLSPNGHNMSSNGNVSVEMTNNSMNVTMNNNTSMNFNYINQQNNSLMINNKNSSQSNNVSSVITPLKTSISDSFSNNQSLKKSPYTQISNFISHPGGPNIQIRQSQTAYLNCEFNSNIKSPSTEGNPHQNIQNQPLYQTIHQKVLTQESLQFRVASDMFNEQNNTYRRHSTQYIEQSPYENSMDHVDSNKKFNFTPAHQINSIAHNHSALTGNTSQAPRGNDELQCTQFLVDANNIQSRNNTINKALNVALPIQNTPIQSNIHIENNKTLKTGFFQEIEFDKQLEKKRSLPQVSSLNSQFQQINDVQKLDYLIMNDLESIIGLSPTNGKSIYEKESNQSSLPIGISGFQSNSSLQASPSLSMTPSANNIRSSNQKPQIVMKSTSCYIQQNQNHDNFSSDLDISGNNKSSNSTLFFENNISDNHDQMEFKNSGVSNQSQKLLFQHQQNSENESGQIKNQITIQKVQNCSNLEKSKTSYANTSQSDNTLNVRELLPERHRSNGSSQALDSSQAPGKNQFDHQEHQVFKKQISTAFTGENANNYLENLKSNYSNAQNENLSRVQQVSCENSNYNENYEIKRQIQGETIFYDNTLDYLDRIKLQVGTIQNELNHMKANSNNNSNNSIQMKDLDNKDAGNSQENYFFEYQTQNKDEKFKIQAPMSQVKNNVLQSPNQQQNVRYIDDTPNQSDLQENEPREKKNFLVENQKRIQKEKLKVNLTIIKEDNENQYSKSSKSSIFQGDLDSSQSQQNKYTTFDPNQCKNEFQNMNNPIDNEKLGQKPYVSNSGLQKSQPYLWNNNMHIQIAQLAQSPNFKSSEITQQSYEDENFMSEFENNSNIFLQLSQNVNRPIDHHFQQSPQLLFGSSPLKENFFEENKHRESIGKIQIEQIKIQTPRITQDEEQQIATVLAQSINVFKNQRSLLLSPNSAAQMVNDEREEFHDVMPEGQLCISFNINDGSSGQNASSEIISRQREEVNNKSKFFVDDSVQNSAYAPMMVEECGELMSSRSEKQFLFPRQTQLQSVMSESQVRNKKNTGSCNNQNQDFNNFFEDFDRESFVESQDLNNRIPNHASSVQSTSISSEKLYSDTRDVQQRKINLDRAQHEKCAHDTLVSFEGKHNQIKEILVRSALNYLIFLNNFNQNVLENREFQNASLLCKRIFAQNSANSSK